jgi:pyridoxamine 5'-phosphate oxidase
MSIADIRQSYDKFTLLEKDAKASPYEQFSVWFDEALSQNVAEPTAMALATADARGRPSSRIVLLKGVDDQGFLFFTNYESRKGVELSVQPWASLLFFWQPLEREVRIEGVVEKVTAAESDAYFQTRPVGSQIGAWSSEQSRPIASRETLEARVLEMEQRFADNPDIPRPESWGGFVIEPERIEFWAGRTSRLHDRVSFTRESQGWSATRLQP